MSAKCELWILQCVQPRSDGAAMPAAGSGDGSIGGFRAMIGSESPEERVEA